MLRFFAFTGYKINCTQDLFFIINFQLYKFRFNQFKL